MTFSFTVSFQNTPPLPSQPTRRHFFIILKTLTNWPAIHIQEVVNFILDSYHWKAITFYILNNVSLLNLSSQV